MELYVDLNRQAKELRIAPELIQGLKDHHGFDDGQIVEHIKGMFPDYDIKITEITNGTD